MSGARVLTAQTSAQRASHAALKLPDTEKTSRRGGPVLRQYGQAHQSDGDDGNHNTLYHDTLAPMAANKAAAGEQTERDKRQQCG
jgi:hypothetical protein